MIVAALTLALALAAPPAGSGAEQKPITLEQFMSQPQPDNCRAQVQDALAKAGIDPQAYKPETPGPTTKREWRPGDHPEAGGYYTLNKMVDGCMVPVPMAGTKVITPQPKAERKTVIINGRPTK